MLARQVHAVLVLVATNHAGVGVRPLTHQGHLDLADIGLVGPDLEDCLVPDLEQIASLPLHRESFPSAVGGAHVFDIELSV